MVASPLELLAKLAQLCPHPPPYGPPEQYEAFTVQPRPTDLGDAEEVERVRLPLAAAGPVSGRKAPKLDQPCLLGVQLQPEALQSLAQLGHETLRFASVLEAHDEVVGVAHLYDLTPRLPSPPAVDP